MSAPEKRDPRIIRAERQLKSLADRAEKLERKAKAIEKSKRGATWKARALGPVRLAISAIVRRVVTLSDRVEPGPRETVPVERAVQVSAANFRAAAPICLGGESYQRARGADLDRVSSTTRRRNPRRGEEGFVHVEAPTSTPHPLGHGALHADFVTTEHDGKNPDAQQRKRRLAGEAPWGRPLPSALATRDRRSIGFRGWHADREAPFAGPPAAVLAHRAGLAAAALGKGPMFTPKKGGVRAA